MTLIERAAAVFEITPADLCGPAVEPHLVEARAAVAWVLRTRGYTLIRIARQVGRSDHTTVLNLLKRGNALAGDPAWLRRLHEIAH